MGHGFPLIKNIKAIIYAYSVTISLKSNTAVKERIWRSCLHYNYRKKYYMKSFIFACETKTRISSMESSTYVYLPKITCGNIVLEIVAFVSLKFLGNQPMIFEPDANHVMIQPLFIVLSFTPFVSGLVERVTPPLFANLWHSWVIIFHPHKRATGIRSRIRLTAKVLDNSFTSTVSGRGHVERTSLLFTTEESQLSERHIRSEFFHGASVENNVPSLVKADSIVGLPEGGLNR